MRDREMKRFFARARSFGMPEEQKEARKKDLVHFMKTMPLRKEASEQRSFFFRYRYAAFLPTLAVTFFTVSGVAYAAEGALPGEMLYTVKTHVNEGVREIFAVSDRDKAALHARLAMERLREAELLAAQGKLDERTAREAEERFEAHMTDFETDIASVHEPEENFRLRVDLTSALQGHTDVFYKLDKESGSRQTHADDEDTDGEKPMILLGDGARNAFIEQEKRANELRNGISGADGSFKNAAENALRAAEKKMEEARKVMRTRKDVPQTSFERAVFQLEQAEGALQSGKREFESGKMNSAFLFAEQARMAAGEALFRIETAEKFGITVDMNRFDADNDRSGADTSEKAGAGPVLVPAMETGSENDDRRDKDEKDERSERSFFTDDREDPDDKSKGRSGKNGSDEKDSKEEKKNGKGSDR